MGNEYVLRDTDFLVSQTDAKGRILFANEDFCTTAGFTIHELIGQPHNIVRHPDMPSAAFKSLWETVKSGKTWTGYVKNRTKSGQYYWVYAMVYPTPIYGTNETGYLSCRRKPSSAEIATAEKLYQTMR